MKSTNQSQKKCGMFIGGISKTNKTKQERTQRYTKQTGG